MRGEMNFLAPMDVRPRYHANDATRDVLLLDPQVVAIEDARRSDHAPTLEREGFRLFERPSAVSDFTDPGQVASLYLGEVRQLLLEVSGADEVAMIPGGVLRFSERSGQSGKLNNSRPARFVHVDVSAATAGQFAARNAPRQGAGLKRYALYNAWRVLTPPPQDVPLAVCDARSLWGEDLVPADAVFDTPGQAEWSFEGLVIRHSPRQRWMYYADMRPDEVLVFRTNDSAAGDFGPVAHSAFTVNECPPGTVPRASIEVRGIAYWYA